MIFIPNCHLNHTKIEFGMILVVIWYEYHTSVFAVQSIYLYILPYQMIALVRGFLWQLVFLGQKFQKKNVLYIALHEGGTIIFKVARTKFSENFYPRTKIFLSKVKKIISVVARTTENFCPIKPVIAIGQFLIARRTRVLSRTDST